MKNLTRTAAAAMLISLPMTLGACGGGSDKPSKSDVKAGYIKAVKAQAGTMGAKVPDSLYDKMSDCIVDKTYDHLSTPTLEKLKSGKLTSKTKVKSADKSKLQSASRECQKKYAADLSKVSTN